MGKITYDPRPQDMIQAGERLRAQRLRQGLTLEEVAKATKIRASFLSAIEKGEYRKLPEKTYAHGFVSNYAEFLGLPKQEILALFRREFDERKLYKVLPEGLTKGEDFSFRTFKLQQTALSIFLIFFILLGYFLFQYRYLVLNPPLEVISPKEGAAISSRVVVVSGTTDPNATVYVNNQPVSLNGDGSFRKRIDLFPGRGTIFIKVVNRFGKETTIIRHVEVKPGS